MASPEAEIRPLDASAGGELDELIALYRACIPASERKSDAAVREMGGRGDYRVLVGAGREAILGFAAALRLRAAPVWLLEYMGVDAAVRSGGLGGRLFEAVAAEAAAEGRPLVVEIEAPGGADAEAQERRRRKAFYLRLGCRTVAGLAYLLPLGTDPPPPAMELLIRPAAPLAAVAKPELRAWLCAIYPEAYGCTRDDPRIEAMLAGLPDPVALI